MCGIAGIIGKQGPADPQAVQTMLDTIRHRGPDGEGLYQDGRVTLGHRRLAILDLRPDGNQPMDYADRYVIVYNGEVYNYLELREELRALGHTFRTETDTEVILAAYAQWGAGCEARFNGMWAFALYDRQEQTVFFSRDRFGVKPLYYWDAPEGFFFGSEIKELWTQMPKPIKANEGVLLAYLSIGEFDYSEQTCFAGVYQLRGGHHLRYDVKTGVFTVERWFELGKFQPKTKDTYAESAAKTRRLFEQAVRLRLRSDVPVGSTLSGGLDSSAIVCTLNRIKPADMPLQTISSCFQAKAFDEQEYMDAVIERTGAVSHKIWPDIKLDLEALDQDIWQEDEPYTSVAGRAVYRKARELNLPVILVGEGADEHLVGYPEFFEAQFLELLQHGRLGVLVEQLRKYKKEREPYNPVSVKHLASVSLSDFLFPTRVRDAIRVRRKGYVAGRFTTKRCLRHREVYRARNLYTGASADKLIRAFLLEEIPRILHALDRNSMAYSVETRAPFLDIELIEALVQMPLSY